MRGPYYFGLWLLLLSTAALAAPPLTLTEHSSGTSLNAAIELFEDTSGQLSIEQVASAEYANRFQPAAGKTGAGINPNPWWIRIRLQRSDTAPNQWWLENGSINVRDLRLYWPSAEGWQERQSGERIPFSQGRDYPMRSFVFQLPLLTDQPFTFYVRSFNPAGNLFPLSIWQFEALQQRHQFEQLIYGMIYGAMLALLLYNICLLTIFRDKSYFWYVWVTFTGLILSLCTSGHGFQYLWPDQPVSLWVDRTTLPTLWSMLIIQFTMVLLYTRDGLRWTHWIFWSVTAIYAATIVINGLGYTGLAAQLMTFTPLISIPAAIFCAVYRSRSFLPARLYLLGYGLVFSSGVLMILRSAGVLPPYPFVSYAFPLSVALESLLFAFALAYRIQLLRREKEHALKLAHDEKSARLNQFQDSAAHLQRLVDERTHALAQSNEQLRKREHALEHAANHDALTGLPNRRDLLSHVHATLDYAQRQHLSVALILLDLDHFKPINDAYGHDAGDHVLRIMAKRLRDNIRSHDRVARLGGDEFAILLAGPDAAQQACEVAERLLKPENQRVTYAKQSLEVGISIGIAEYPLQAQDFDGLYQMADQALYQAKRSGRSCYRRYEPSGKAWVPEPSL